MSVGYLRPLFLRELVVTEPNLITVNELLESMCVTVKIRYRSPFAPAVIETSIPGEIRVRFEHPVMGVCPGQAAVFYNDDTVVGGGIIER